MRRLFVLLGLVTVLVSACCHTEPPPVIGKAKSSYNDGNPASWVTLANLPAITGNSATIVLFDTTRGGTVTGQYKLLERVLWSGGHFSQAITLKCQIMQSTGSVWRTCPSQENADGSDNTSATVNLGGMAVSATADYTADFMMQGPEMRLEAITGGTGPSASEYSIKLYYDRELGQ